MRRLRQLGLLLALLAWCAPAQATSTISRIGSCVGTTSCTPPTHQAGDLFLVFVFRDGNTTAPTLASGWTNIDTAGANTSSYRTACKMATGSAETVTGFTSGSELIALVYRGTRYATSANCAASVVGGQATESTGATNSIVYNNATFTDTGGTSWMVYCAGHRTATDVQQAPTGLTNITSTGTEAACHDSNATATGFTGSNVTVDASSGWHAKGFEIRACTAQICIVNARTFAEAAASTTTIPFTAIAATAGNALAVISHWTGGAVTVSSIADTAGNTFTQGTSCLVTNTDRTDIWYAANITGNTANAVTVTFSAAATFRQGIVYQISGADTTTPFEVCGTGAGTSTTLASSSFSPAAANNINLAMGNTPGTGPTTYTAGANYVLTDMANNFGAEHRVDAPSGAQTATMTVGSSVAWMIAVGSFKPPGGGGATPVPKMMMMGVGD